MGDKTKSGGIHLFAAGENKVVVAVQSYFAVPSCKVHAVCCTVYKCTVANQIEMAFRHRTRWGNSLFFSYGRCSNSYHNPYPIHIMPYSIMKVGHMVWEYMYTEYKGNAHDKTHTEHTKPKKLMYLSSGERQKKKTTTTPKTRNGIFFSSQLLMNMKHNERTKSSFEVELKVLYVYALICNRDGFLQ